MSKSASLLLALAISITACAAKEVTIKGYTKKDGTVVKGYERKKKTPTSVAGGETGTNPGSLPGKTVDKNSVKGTNPGPAKTAGGELGGNPGPPVAKSPSQRK